MSDTNVHPLVPKIKRRVKTIRNRLRTSGPNHADTADLCGYVEQLVMWYEASQDMLGDVMHENTANVAALAELEREVNAYRIGVHNFGAGFPWGGDE